MNTPIHNRILLSLSILICSYSFAQSTLEKWLPIAVSPTKLIYVDVLGLENFTGDDIFVWVKENHFEPLEIEGVRDDVYQSKTYYLFNKKLEKYSILEVIYYNEDGNVLKYYNYNRETDLENYKYNYPILPGSNEEAVLSRCIIYIIENQTK